jgi:hypothetical protein
MEKFFLTQEEFENIKESEEYKKYFWDITENSLVFSSSIEREIFVKTILGEITWNMTESSISYFFNSSVSYFINWTPALKSKILDNDELEIDFSPVTLEEDSPLFKYLYNHYYTEIK